MHLIELPCKYMYNTYSRTFQIFWVQVSVNGNSNSGISKYWPLGNLSCCCLAKEWPQGPFFLQDPVQQRHNFVEPLEKSAYFPSNGARHAIWPPVNYKCHTYLKNPKELFVDTWTLLIEKNLPPPNLYPKCVACLPEGFEQQIFLVPIWISQDIRRLGSALCLHTLLAW